MAKSSTPRVCPVCGKKVGAWHADGVHPKCRDKPAAVRQRYEQLPAEVSGDYIRRMSQKERDAILRRMNTRDR